MKGGHGQSGRVPEADALRRDRPGDAASWVTLPAAGRQGDAPTWPLSRASARELSLWAREWARPQAIMWEANGQLEEVALYVRTLVAAEKRSAPAAVRVLVVRMQETLGLSLPGLARNRWRIGDVATGRTADLKATGTEAPSARARLQGLKVIDGG